MIKPVARSIFVLMLCMFSLSILAEQTETVSAIPNMTATLFQVLGALIFIVMLIFASAWSAKKLRLTGGNDEHAIKMLASLALGRKEKISLVEVCGKRILIGIGSGNISSLHVFEDVVGEKTCGEVSQLTIKGVNTEVNSEVEEQNELATEDLDLRASTQSFDQAANRGDFSKFLAAILKNGGRNAEK